MEKTCLIGCAYLAPIAFYRCLRDYDQVAVECCDTYQKQTYRNRCVIASPNGPQALTVPIVKPTPGHNRMRDIRISDHGNWRHLHWNALQTAYRNSPFFEYYADDFAPFYERKWEFLVDYNEALRLLVCQLIDIEPKVSLTDNYQTDAADLDDFRPLLDPNTQYLIPNTQHPIPPRPYYQVFAQRHGFLPDLSIVDLLFNMGPESVLYL